MYATRDFTNALINSDKANCWTGDDECRVGWVVYDPSKKFRKFRRLKTKDNPGRLYFLYGKDFNYEGSSPPVFSLNE